MIFYLSTCMHAGTRKRTPRLVRGSQQQVAHVPPQTRARGQRRPSSPVPLQTLVSGRPVPLVTQTQNKQQVVSVPSRNFYPDAKAKAVPGQGRPERTNQNGIAIKNKSRVFSYYNIYMHCMEACKSCFIFSCQIMFVDACRWFKAKSFFWSG